jgi:hypothetical protein
MAEPTISFAWMSEVFKFVDNPVPGQPVQKPMTAAPANHPCENDGTEMRLQGSRTFTGNRMVQNTWICPKCSYSYVETGLVRVIA